MNKLLKTIVAPIALVGGGLFYFGHKSTSPPIHTNTSRTDVVWVKYFNDIGQNTKDTECFVIRVAKDTILQTIVGKDTVKTVTTDSSGKKITTYNVNNKYTTIHENDSNYYVPYDTVLRYDTGKIRQRYIKMFIHIPKDWVIFDYNKHGQIMSNDTTLLK